MNTQLHIRLSQIVLLLQFLGVVRHPDDGRLVENLKLSSQVLSNYIKKHTRNQFFAFCFFVFCLNINTNRNLLTPKCQVKPHGANCLNRVQKISFIFKIFNPERPQKC